MEPSIATPSALQGKRGRIAIYCIAESLDRKQLEKKLGERGSKFLTHKYPDVLYGQYSAYGQEPTGDIFYFDYGCVAFWGLTQKQVRPPCGTGVSSLAAWYWQLLQLHVVGSKLHPPQYRNKMCCATLWCRAN